MKRLHVINLEKMGGAEKIFLQYISHNNNGEDVIFCINNRTAEEISTQLNGKDITFVNRIFNSFSLKYPSFMRKIIFHKRIEKEKSDIVIFWDLVPRLSRKLINSKIVYYDHGSSWRIPCNEKTLHFFNLVDACIAVSYASKRIMEKRFKINAPITVIKNTIPKKMDEITRNRPLPSKDNLTLGTASRLVSLKGIGVSIMTLSELLKKGYTAKLYIAGKGPNEIALRKLTEKLNLQEYVFFIGFQKDLSIFYKSIDFYMSTSVSESFGLSCMDAISHGVPCIYSFIDGQVEVIKDGITGVGIKPRISPEEYYNLSGYKVETPFFSYDPTKDELVLPTVVSHLDCFNAIDKIIEENKYKSYLNNIQNHMNSTDNNESVVNSINSFFSELTQKDD